MATSPTKPSDPTTSNYKKAQVLAINELVEEEVTLLIDGTTIICFASYSPYEIEVGKIYDVEITLNLSEHYEIRKLNSNEILVERVGSSYSYALYGMLSQSKFQTFTLLNDEEIHYDYPELNDCFIKLTVERIEASFR
ncbi:hypothetical protein [Pseudomonas costantinii]|uniref:hypothetical protein n=1 Tax=Pseudomonas costantinii TaxID=168469 RepID=UPI0015A0DCC5|nr:hypothetical protein [Pseudomonas costantinii]NVZ70921.1 hypothetical protein [Pseudomonas costantinii]